jgi:hypothetical protein
MRESNVLKFITHFKKLQGQYPRSDEKTQLGKTQRDRSDMKTDKCEKRQNTDEHNNEEKKF